MNVSERPATRMWRDALAQLEELLQQPEDQRQQALGELAATQPQLHSMLVSLLSAEARAESQGFMEPSVARSEALRPDATLGPYRILSQLGAGGMGEVWLAKRMDGLYEGEVAIKTLHPYFGGGALRERFLREARILGRLAHPNIARLLDAGVADDGSVYLVLEYVRGVAIDTWCDNHKLDVGQRLRLFMDVCAAVSHAHANLIVHRDLKPSNILVTEEGSVKLLDFGVAKLVEDDGVADRTELTRLTGRVFTPEYAAPEQILGESITTAADVYSLGVLLHVLLTGTRPYARSGNVVEIERAVVHEEPVRPSRAAAGSADVREIASNRSSTASRLQRSLAGDLDTIATHALRKSPAERYPTVLALSEDVRRHLQHEPILARRENVLARTRKFVRRHRVGVAASVLVGLVMVAGVAGVLWQAQLARAEARKAGAIRDFLVGIFEHNSVAHADGAKASQTTAAQLLAQSAQRIRTDMHDTPEVRSELVGVMAQLYAAMDMQKDALPLLQDRLQSERAMLGDDDLAVARTLSDIAFSQVQMGDYPAAQRSAGESIAIFHSHNVRSEVEYAVAHGTLAQVSYRLGTGKDGTMRRHFQQAADVLAEHHPHNKARIQMILGLSRTANLEQNHDEALRHAQQAIDLIESGTVPAHGIALGTAYQTAGNALTWLARNDEGEALIKKAIAEYDRAGGPEHSFAIEGRRELGALYGWLGKREEAKELLSTALAAQERVKGVDDPELTTHLRAELGRVLMMRGEYAAAEPLLARALDVWKRNGMPTVGPAASLARVYIEQGRFDEAARVLDGTDAAAESAFGKGSWPHATSLNRLGALYLAQRQTSQAEKYFTRTLTEVTDPPNQIGLNRAHAEVGLIRLAANQGDSDIAERALALLAQIEASASRREMPDEEAAAQMLYGIGLMRIGKAQEAQAHMEKGIAMRERMDATESPLLAEARLYLAQQQHLTGERTRAKLLLDQATSAHRAQAVLGPQHRQLLADTRDMVAR